MSSVNELFTRSLNSLTQAKVSRVYMSHDRTPFVYHLYACWSRPDGYTEDEWSHYCLPGVMGLVKVLNRFDMLDAEELPLAAGAREAVRASIVNNQGPIPVRFTQYYDSARQRTVTTADLKVKQVGNYCRRIINGPLHREMMPFTLKPREGDIRTHWYLPLHRPVLMIPGTLDEHGDEISLENVEDWARYPEFVQKYQILGDYCYYLGEEIER